MTHKKARDWDEAFDEAGNLLASGELTALAVVSIAEYREHYAATHLEEFGDPQTTLWNMRGLTKQLRGVKTQIELRHHKRSYVWRDELINGWELVMIYED